MSVFLASSAVPFGEPANTCNTHTSKCTMHWLHALSDDCMLCVHGMWRGNTTGKLTSPDFCAHKCARLLTFARLHTLSLISPKPKNDTNIDIPISIAAYETTWATLNESLASNSLIGWQLCLREFRRVVLKSPSYYCRETSATLSLKAVIFRWLRVVDKQQR